MRHKIFFLFLFFPLFLCCVPSPLIKRKPWPPFVSGDAFREYADYVFDELDTTLNPNEVKPFSTIFVKGDYVEVFFNKIHPYLPAYILITHNSDESAPGKLASFLAEEKVIAWFSQNVDDATNPKMHPIPIGIANREWGHGNGDFILKEMKKKAKKSNLLYLNISVGTYPIERSVVDRLLRKAPYTYSPGSKPFDQYLTDIASSKFVASPRGNGLDTHRLWESLYLGSYPIVKTSTLDSLYADLPVVIIQDWSEVNEKFLNKKYKELKEKSFKLDKLQFSYWAKLIDSFRAQK